MKNTIGLYRVQLWSTAMLTGVMAAVLGGCALSPTHQAVSVAAIPDPQPAREVCERARVRKIEVVDPAIAGADLNAIAWMQTSVEYRANATSVYRAAVKRLEEIYSPARSSKARPLAAMEQTVAPPTGTPYAVILDIDETLLDNSPQQARLFADGSRYSQDVWDCWSSLEQAVLIPGAEELFVELDRLASRGISVRAQFITNRLCGTRGKENCPQRRETVNNINRLISKHGYRVMPADLLMKNDPDPQTGQPRWTDSEKHERRVELAKRYHIVLMIGDDLGDFYPSIRSKPMAARCEATSEAASRGRWGDTWFMLPNAMYGSWPDAIKTAEGPIPRAEALEAYNYPDQPATDKRAACWTD